MRNVTEEECRSRHGWMKWGFGIILVVLGLLTTLTTYGISNSVGQVDAAKEEVKSIDKQVQVIKISLETHIAAQNEHEKHVLEKLDRIEKKIDGAK